MLIQKEVIRPGTYFYIEEGTGLPRKLTVTPELTKHWHDQGNAMLSAGLPVPVPYEHDFSAHPMTPKDKLLNNAGEVKQYTLKGDVLFSTVDVQDPEVKKKIGRSIRWTSPWFNSFTDGAGKRWDNVISHLALTTRPRVTKQEPFASIAAALSIATEVKYIPSTTEQATSWIPTGPPKDGICLSRAGLLSEDPTTKIMRPNYPMAFSLWGGGIKLSEGDMPFKKKDKAKGSPKKKEGESGGGTDGGKPPIKKEGAGESSEGGGMDDTGEDAEDGGDITNPLADASGDVCMEEVLCDLLQALGVPMPDDTNESQFKRHLYEAAMHKITELATSNNPASPQNATTAKEKVQQQHQKMQQPNPLIGQVQQEQQPMYMSLEDINKIPDEMMKSIALSMYAENQKLRTELDSNKKVTDSLRDAKLKEAAAARKSRVTLLGRLSPRVKADLDAMVALPSMALSMGDGGAVLDPMAQTLVVLEKGLGDLPRLLTADTSALSLVPQPKDADELTAERAEEIADSQARMMGCPPQQKRAS